MNTLSHPYPFWEQTESFVQKGVCYKQESFGAPFLTSYRVEMIGSKDIRLLPHYLIWGDLIGPVSLLLSSSSK